MTSDNNSAQFNKTKMCKFEVLGRCKKGRECPFAHVTKELRQLPDLRRTKLCKSFVLTAICADANCNYAHCKNELRSTGASCKTKMCRFMQAGQCALGAKCNFAHSKSELRKGDKFAADEKSAKLDQSGVPGTGIPCPPGLPAPPGLCPPSFGSESVSSPSSFTETGKLLDEDPKLDLSSLVHALDKLLSMGGQAAQEVATTAKATTLKPWSLTCDSPAYVCLPPTPEGRVSAVTSQPVKTTAQWAYWDTDSLKADEQSLSTQSPPASPKSPISEGSGTDSSDRNWGNLAFVTGADLRHVFDHEVWTQSL